MKVRIGYGLGNLRPLSGDALGALAEGIERNGFDSLWLSERISGPAPDPVLALTFAAARTKKIKLGTSVSVLPGRSPALVAKEWATLDVLSGGRALPAFGLGIAHPVEQQAFGVERARPGVDLRRGAPAAPAAWAEDDVDHDGRWFHYEHMNVLPKPAHPLDVWLGGRAPSELRRVGRLADGWLASFTTPEQCKAARVTIEDAADAAGREIDPEHFGAMVFYTHDALPDAFAQAIRTPQSRRRARRPRRARLGRLHDLCERYVAVGFSKLVLVPLQRTARTGTTSSRPAPPRCCRSRTDRELRSSGLEEAAQADDRADHADRRRRSTSTRMPMPNASADVTRNVDSRLCWLLKRLEMTIFSTHTSPNAKPAPIAPCTRPSAMNGTRTNQFDAPTSFITSISRRRANVASRIVFTIRNSDDASSTLRHRDERVAGSSGSRSAAS